MALFSDGLVYQFTQSDTFSRVSPIFERVKKHIL